MRVSKLEPHVQGSEPPDLGEETSEAVSAESKSIKETQESSDRPIDGEKGNQESLHKGFVRLADFLKKERSKKFEKESFQSSRQVAVRAYQKQQIQFSDTEEALIVRLKGVNCNAAG